VELPLIFWLAPCTKEQADFLCFAQNAPKSSSNGIFCLTNSHFKHKKLQKVLFVQTVKSFGLFTVKT
jgi:hypothetical protein